MSTTPPDPDVLCTPTPPEEVETNPAHDQAPQFIPIGLDQAPEQKKSPWETCLSYAKKQVDDEIELWKDEVDKLLIFATLFSGVAGSFALESYHSVKQDPADTTVLLLKTLISIQINATNPQPNLPINLDPQAPATAAAKRINVYNFLSLILSLSVVMAGILCLQWLREYGQDPHGIPGARREHLGIRYMRRQGMKKWGVFFILKLLPLILLLSLLLFFAGIIELLRDVDNTATIVASVFIGITTSFIFVTTALPAFQSFYVHFSPGSKLPECPYKSPQAWIFYQLLAEPIRLAKVALAECRGQSHSVDPTVIDVFNLQTWSGYDWLVYHNHSRLPDAISNAGFGVHWLGKLYLQEKDVAKALYRCIRDSSILDSLRSILTTRDSRRATSVGEASRWSPPNAAKSSDTDNSDAIRAHEADVIIFQTLAHLAEQIERGHPPTVLLQERLDLYLKINSASKDPNIDCPLINDNDQKELVSYGTRKTIEHHIISLLESGSDINDSDINSSHLVALDHIVGLEFDSGSPDNQLFDTVLGALRRWAERKHEGWNIDDEPRQDQGIRTPSKLQLEARQLYNRVHMLRRLAQTKK